MAENDPVGLDLSLVRDDLPFRLQRRIGLIPQAGFGLVRRAVFFALLSWLPLAIWAIVKGRALPGEVAEPLLHHFGIHVRFLVAVPLFILGEATLHQQMTRLIPYFATSGLVRPEQREQLREIIRGIIRLRDKSTPWLIIAVIVAAQALFERPSMISHELIWADTAAAGTFDPGFAGWWFHFVSRPIFSGSSE